MQSHQCLVKEGCLSWTNGSTFWHSLLWERISAVHQNPKVLCRAEKCFPDLALRESWCLELLSPGRELCFSFCWASQDSSQPISPACLSPSGWKRNHPLTVPLSFAISVRTCWGFVLSLMKILKYCPQYQPLGYTTSYLPPGGLYDSDQN